MVSSVVNTFGDLDPSAQGFLQSLADVACVTGVVDRGSWLGTAQQHMSRARVVGVASGSVTIIRVRLKALGKAAVMVM